MNADMQRILDKATELLDMMTAVQNKWAAQGRAGDVRKLIEAETTIRDVLNGTSQPSYVVPREFKAISASAEEYLNEIDEQIKEELSIDKPDAPKRGKK